MRACEEQPSHLRVPPASRTCDSPSDSHVHTDGQTNPEANNDSDILQLSDAHPGVQADDDGLVTFGAVLAAGVLPTGKRFPTVRTGPRSPIPYQVRAAVWLRDRGICQKCRTRNPKPWELDHILPWSAGGSDASTNLRVLCAPCNQERSNYDDRTTFARAAVTWWCHRCYVDPVSWRYDVPNGVRCPTHRTDWASQWCNVERVYGWQRGADEPPTWHQRLPIETFSARAFCAHCSLPGLTDVTL